MPKSHSALALYTVMTIVNMYPSIVIIVNAFSTIYFSQDDTAIPLPTMTSTDNAIGANRSPAFSGSYVHVLTGSSKLDYIQGTV